MAEESTAFLTRLRKAIRYRRIYLRHKWWSLQNWRKGYKFGVIQRFRCCGHTTPFHYQWCPEHPAYIAPSPQESGSDAGDNGQPGG